jgi:outer membrane protein assembly factor BamA
MSKCPAWRVVLLGVVLQSALQAGDETLIDTVQIRGTRRPVELATRAGEPLDLARVERDVRRLWGTGWFQDIQVESSDTPQGVQLTFALVEKRRFYLRKVEFKPASERRLVNLAKGAPLDPMVAARVAGALRRRLVEEGYADAKVEAAIVPAGFQKADLQIRVERGRLYRVEAVRFSGALGLGPRELERAVDDIRPHRLLPSLGPIWSGWRLLAPFSEKAAEADAQRLRSLYLSRGFFDARVEVARIDIAERKATVLFHVDAGQRYRVRQLEIPGEQGRKLVDAASSPQLAQKLCGCLLKARTESEKRGELALAARLEVRQSAEPRAGAAQEGIADTPLTENEPEVSLTVRIEKGPGFRVGRLEFLGHHKVSDSTLRKALVLREGDLFDQGRLRRSLARLNRLGLIEPLAPSDVRVETEADQRIVNLAIPVKDAPRGYWSLAGPLGSLSAFGSLGYTIGSRLPAVGGGPLELSTYYATFSLLAWSSPLTGLLPLAFKTQWTPLVTLQRPYLPGQRWQSGFTVAPQLGWRVTAAGYGLAHLSEGVRAALGGDSLPADPLAVPLVWRSRTRDESAGMVAAGFLICDEPKPSWAWLRSVATTLGDVATGGILAGQH